MSVTKLFEETFYLGFEDMNLNKNLIPKDILLSDKIFLRIEPDKITFHYLFSSDQIIIPGVYINLFLGIDRLMGDRLSDSKTNLEKTLFLGSKLVRMIYGGDKIMIDSLLSLLVKIGSKQLRDFLKNKFEYKMEPWILRNSQNTVEI